jgi:6-phosphogluconolactonase/glucosamine-6-phosphate isomerase/deaminase
LNVKVLKDLVQGYEKIIVLFKKKKKKLALKELIKENEQRPLPASLLQDFNSVLY